MLPRLDSLLAFLPELVLLLGALALFDISLGTGRARAARRAALLTALLTLAAGGVALGREAALFHGAYRVDAFSQWLKLVIGLGYLVVVLAGGRLADIREEVRSEYHLFLTLSVCGWAMLVSCVELITLVVALELASFPLYLMVALRREREGQRSQMEAAVKYLMFGIAANGIMVFGIGYLFGVTGTTSLPAMLQRLPPVAQSPLAVAGLLMTFGGLYYKLAVFPFHFWTPDVYQGAANETATLIASLPKIGAVAVLTRLVALATPQNPAIAVMLALLAGASMCYGNLLALVQSDLKRLLGFSGIAHAGYVLMGFVALDPAGSAAALYAIVAYVFMVLAVFTVVCTLSPDGANVAVEDLAGLHRRAPLLALTLLVGIFGLAGMPPFAGFTAKFALLKAAFARGHLALVIVAVVNTAIALYYYLNVVRTAYFGGDTGLPAVALDGPTRLLCVALVAGVIGLGVVPGPFLEFMAASLVHVRLPP
ncbi:MAG: NADH-quinone oxidoreductase subunit N [Verrucomicrobia bacterium]|nr:NADH-quinone oxidoreductase subunit N [Verrucomicrobiota bacterium]